ncbi:MAG: LON peptidase substrate-binding domain-containing protein [Betaproteobacteria bacterium]|nr:LON peptidase substrate-binding domain-containing protein [Betaproteobacteria bacterium]
MPAGTLQEVFLFPLHTVLFPGGTLPLKVFEQRYIELTKICLRDNRPFGVCLIKEGREVGAPATPHATGCLATIIRWDMPQLGVFQLVAQGTQRFAIVRSAAGNNGLISATVELLPEEIPSAPRDEVCVQVLKAIVERVGAERFPAPPRFDEAGWVGYRLAEALPLSATVKQQLLEMSDAHARLALLHKLIARQGLLG